MEPPTSPDARRAMRPTPFMSASSALRRRRSTSCSSAGSSGRSRLHAPLLLAALDLHRVRHSATSAATWHAPEGPRSRPRTLGETLVPWGGRERVSTHSGGTPTAGMEKARKGLDFFSVKVRIRRRPAAQSTDNRRSCDG